MIWVATGAMTTVLLAAMALLSFWVSRSFDSIDRRFDRMDARFDRMEDVVLRDHSERIARLEAQQE